MEQVAIQLSCYNGARYLPHLLASLRAQSFRGWKLYVTDNASEPVQAEAVRAFAKELGDRAVYVDVGPVNVDFAGAHNLLFKQHQAPYVMLHNDDAILDAAYLERLVAALDADARLGSVSGRIYRWDFDHALRPDGGRTDVVDSFGLDMAVTGAVSDIGSGERVSAELLHDGVHEVFGVSGCLPLYRRDAVLKSSPDGNLFDPSFVSYKEDVELAWRLRRVGCTSAVVSDAVAYHRRSFAAGQRAAQAWRPLFHSYRNHLWMLKAHLGSPEAPARLWAAAPYELAKAAYWLILRPEVAIRAWRETWQRKEALKNKRAFYSSLGEGSLRRPSPLRDEKTMSTHYDVSIVIVSHNDLNAECLASVERARKASGLKVGVVVVDNNTTAFDAAKVLWESIPDGVIVQRNWDAGYGSSMNRGAKELDADYVFILNPDTVLIDDRILAKLVAFMKAHPKTGIAAPKVVYPDGKLQETVRRFPGWQVPILQRTKLGDTAYGKKYLNRFLMRDVPHDATRMVDWAQGSAMFLPMDLWKSLGGFDDRFWMYFEDVDLCRRSWEMNRPVYYVADAVMQHAFGKASVRQGSLLRTLLTNKMARAHSLSFLKYMAKWPQDLFRPQPK